MKKMLRLVWAMALLTVVFTACSDDDETSADVQKIDIQIGDLTSSSAVITIPEVSGAHNYDLEVYDMDGVEVDWDFFSSYEVEDGKIIYDELTSLDASTEYKVVVEATKNVLTEGIVVVAKDSVNFITLAE